MLGWSARVQLNNIIALWRCSASGKVARDILSGLRGASEQSCFHSNGRKD